MNKIILSVLVLVLHLEVAVAQLQIKSFNTLSEQEYFREVFEDKSVVITKIEQLKGAAFQHGIFAGGKLGFNLQQGYVISTGNVEKIPGSPEDQIGLEAQGDGFPPFRTLYNQETYDYVHVRIEFIPLGDTLSLKYVLGSELYDITTCGEDNDLVGIFVRSMSEWQGENWQNLATVPGKPDIPVSPYTVNDKSDTNSSAGCSELDDDWISNSIYYNGPSTDNALNGLTVPLSSHPISVVPGETYELHIVVANGGQDDLTDSAIFIEDKTLTAKSNTGFYRSDRNIKICPGETINYRGTQITEEGRFVIKISSENAPIDSFLVVLVEPDQNPKRGRETISICPGESITVAGQVINHDTTIINTLPLPECDSIIYYFIKTLDGKRSEVNHQLCLGDTLHVQDTFFTEDGSFEEIVIKEHSCDDLILHQFTFSTPINTKKDINACSGDTIFINGIPYTETQSFQEQYTASGGCDSIVDYNLVFDAPYTKVIHHRGTRFRPTFLQGDTLFIRDTFFTQNGIFKERIIVPDGCDTIIEHRIFFEILEVEYDKSLDGPFCLEDTISLIYGQTYFAKRRFEEWETLVGDSIIGNGASIQSTINVDHYESGEVITKPEDLGFVKLTIDHSNVHDLDVSLSCPNGQTVLLQEHAPLNRPTAYYGGSTYGLYWTPFHADTWKDTEPIWNSNLLGGFNYGSKESMEALVGCPLNGDWTLHVKDSWSRDDGTWSNWGIGFPATEGFYDRGELQSWSWSATDPSGAFIRLERKNFFDFDLFPLTTGTFSVFNGIYLGAGVAYEEPVFTFDVTDPYLGPTVTLDTISCGPLFLHDTLIVTSGLYDLYQQVPDYCTSIPVQAHVTIAQADTTFLSTTTCEFSDSDLNIETLSNQYGCDSLIFTGIQLVVDTVFSQNISCLPNITTINRSFETLEVVVDNACDYVSVIEYIEVPIDTTYLEEMVCDPEEAGVTTVVFPNQFGCDSVIITDHVLALDTTYISSTTCQFEDAGIQEITLTNGYGCDSLVIADIVLEVDTVFTSPIECNPAIDVPSTEIVIENINVEDGCDYVSVQEVLSAPIDTTYLVTPSCQVRDSLPTIEVLDNQFGCDSVVITSFNLRFDTLTHIINTCTAGIASPQQLIDTEWLIDENACDTFQITITNLLPLDTTLVTTASCNPQDTGTFYQTLPNQYLCDSLVITEVEFDPDTLYLETNTCYPQDSGWHLQILEQADGCQTLEWTYRQYIPLEYDWLIAADTCGFGQGSASFVPANSGLDYAFEWDGPAAAIDPTALFQGVYNVTITATGDTYPEACVDTSRVIIGGISALPQATFTYEALDLDYQFSGEVIEADTFYWDFGDGNSSIEINPAHTFAQTGTYTVCLIAQNGCGTQQDCQAIVTLKDYSIGGKIETAPNFPASSGINGVKVSLSGEQVNLEGISNAEGAFIFPKQFEGYEYSLQPEKEDDILNGLDVSDVLKIAQAANGSRELEVPYELLAADVNCDASITTEDALYLNQLLLGQQDQFPDDCSSWIFWPQSYVFPNPAEPFNPNSAILIENLQTESLNNDYYGLKRGDLGANADAARSPTELDTLFLQIENGIIQAGDTIQLDFRVRNFSELVGVQFEFLIDTFALTYHDISLGDLEVMTMEHFGTDGLEQGILRVIWLDLLGQPHSLADGDVLFSLQLIAKQKINDRQSKMEISTRDLAASYFNEALEEGVVQLLVDDLVDIVNVNNEFFQLGQNRPNPFQHTTIIPFQLSAAAPINLKVYSQLGQLVWQEEGRFPAGKSELEVDIRAPGIYYYSIETPWGKATRKMVRVE